MRHRKHFCAVRMRSVNALILGFVLGLVVGGGGTALAQKIIGGNGFLFGWTVTAGGDEICSDPWVWTAIKEIECD